jgi:tetratricopeptide (TPR) repeat protein
LDDFEKAAMIDKSNSEIFIYANLCSLESSNYKMIDSGIKNCQIVADAEGEDPMLRSSALQSLAHMYIEKQDYEQAKNHLLMAKQLTLDDTNLYISLSNLYFILKDFDLAEQNDRFAISNTPTSAKAFKYLSQSLYMQEKYRDSINEAEKGISLVDEDVSLLVSNKLETKRDLYLIIANDYRRLGDTENEEKYRKMSKIEYPEDK